MDAGSCPNAVVPGTADPIELQQPLAGSGSQVDCVLAYLLKRGGVEQVPEGVDCLALCKNAMEKYSLEIAGGLGPSAGKVWRVGIMVSTLHLETLRLWLGRNAWKMGCLMVQAAHICQLCQMCSLLNAQLYLDSP